MRFFPALPISHFFQSLETGLIDLAWVYCLSEKKVLQLREFGPLTQNVLCSLEKWRNFQTKWKNVFWNLQTSALCFISQPPNILLVALEILRHNGVAKLCMLVNFIQAFYWARKPLKYLMKMHKKCFCSNSNQFSVKRMFVHLLENYGEAHGTGFIIFS